MKFNTLQIVTFKNENYQITEILENSEKDYKISGGANDDDLEVLESEITLADEDKQVGFSITN